MVDRSNNYRWEIPEKFKVDWYDDFVRLINQIDASLKNEELTRQQVDNTLLELINNLGQIITQYYVYIPLRNLTSGLAEYSGTTWAERVNAASYTKEYFGLPPDYIVEVKYYTYFRAKMANAGEVGYIKSRFRQTIPSGQYVETPVETINTTSWQHFSRVVDVPVSILTPDGLLDAMLLLKVDNGTIQAYMDRTFLLIKMKSY